MDKDASQMTDDELKEKINPSEEPKEELVPEVPEEPLKEEEPTEELPEPEKEPEKEPEAEEERPISRREQLRVQDLLSRGYKPKETPPEVKAPDFRTKVEADEDTHKIIEDTATEFGRQQYEQGLERAQYYQWETLLNIDEPQVRTKYPELDPNNKEKFHPALHNAMLTKFAMYAGYDAGNPDTGVARTVRNPQARFSDFVEAEMEYADELAAHRVKQTTENIAKQAAQTSLRPDGSSTTKMDLTKNPEDMTTEELYAVLGQTPPKK
jgi:hypothetical protein